MIFARGALGGDIAAQFGDARVARGHFAFQRQYLLLQRFDIRRAAFNKLEILAQAVGLGGQRRDLLVGRVQLRLNARERVFGGGFSGLQIEHLRLERFQFALRARELVLAARELRLRLGQRGLRLDQRGVDRFQLGFQRFLVGGKLFGLPRGLGERLFQRQILAALLLEQGVGAGQLRVALRSLAVEIDHTGDGRDEQYQQHRQPDLVFALHKQPSMRIDSIIITQPQENRKPPREKTAGNDPDERRFRRLKALRGAAWCDGRRRSRGRVFRSPPARAFRRYRPAPGFSSRSSSRGLPGRCAARRRGAASLQGYAPHGRLMSARARSAAVGVGGGGGGKSA